ncbi:MAG TPA: TonB-dependent receptor [Acidobacteriaceae bacterium]
MAPAPQTARQTSLAGNVTDPSNALIPGVTITLHSAADEKEQTSTTDSSGRFQFQGLAFGQYNLTATREGFAEYRGKLTLSPSKPSVRFDVRLKIATDEQQVDVDSSSDTLDPNNNPDGVTLTQQQIDSLPDDPTLLSQELQGLAGGGGAEVRVDGFSGGSIPPKNTIREIRINQNAYSAKNDTDPVEGLIEILTKPGSDKPHGSFFAYGNTSAMNAKNRFYPNQPAYDSISVNGNVSGPITKRASYFLNGGQFISNSNQTIAAEILDANLNQVSFTQALPQSSKSLFFNPRFDLQAGKNDTLSIRYQFSRSIQNNAGAGGLNLASQGYDGVSYNQTLQLSNSQTIGGKIVNETRFQYQRRRVGQDPYSTALGIAVQGAFNDGGSPGGRSQDNQDSYELQDYVLVSVRKHFLNFGVRLRSGRDANHTGANFNGQYTFASLDAYQITRKGLLLGHSADQIAADGGGPSQFTLTTGNPSVAVTMTDAGLFAQDDWKLKPTFTLSFGLRYEIQTHVSDDRNFAPRLGFAWSFGPKKSSFTLSGGTGFFYHRFPLSSILNAERQNGVNQQQYVVIAPKSYPNIPTAADLGAQVTPSTYLFNPHYRAEDVYVASLNLSHAVFKRGRLSANYWYARGMHDPLTRNINAPLPGTYDPSVPTSGVRPLGGANNVYRYDSDGLSSYYRFMPNFFYSTPKGGYVTANYQLVWHTGDTSGGFPSNQYNIGVDKGPARLDTRNRITVGGGVPLRWHFNISGYLQANSAPPFNIVIGRDLNGDSVFNDRPAFATDLTRPSVVPTQWGALDTDPLPSQRIVPFNYGRAPGNVTTTLILYRNFGFGPEQRPPGAKPGAKGPFPRKYTVTLYAIASNVFNHPNLATPNGTLGSPLFGQSLNLAGTPREINFETSLRF